MLEQYKEDIEEMPTVDQLFAEMDEIAEQLFARCDEFIREQKEKQA